MSELSPNILVWALDEKFNKDRMCFLAGPRQIGKTTLLQKYLASFGLEGSYYNWDISGVRNAYRKNPDFFVADQASLKKFSPLPIVFDEFHKYPKWKSHLKGLYDQWKGRIRFIITGSARLDFMRKSGDSLLGRYFLYRKLPMHPRECVTGAPALPGWRPGKTWETGASSSEWIDAVENLFRLNGFPEPFLSGSKEFLNRWQSEHLSLLVTEDLADLTKIEQVLRVEELAELLRTKVGSPLSTNNIAQVIGASFPAVKRWLTALEFVYLTFRTKPYSRKIARAMRKEPKLYFWDWSLVEDPALRFENMVAVYLMRAVSCWNERGFGKFDLRFVRTRDKVEVDFLVTDSDKPRLLIETKLSDEEVAPSLSSMKRLLKTQEAWQVINKHSTLRPHREKGIWVMGIDRFLQLTP